MNLFDKIFSCTGRKSANRSAKYEIEIRLHSSCRSVDPKNLKSYQVSRAKAKAAEKKDNDDELYVCSSNFRPLYQNRQFII